MENCIVTQSRLLIKQWLIGNNFLIATVFVNQARPWFWLSTRTSSVAGLALFFDAFTRTTLIVCPMARTVIHSVWRTLTLYSLHWSFAFIEISTLMLSAQTKIQKNNFGLHMRPLKFVSAPQKAKHYFNWSILTADDSIKCRCANSSMTQAKWVVFKILGFVCKSFLPFFPTPSPLFY